MAARLRLVAYVLLAVLAPVALSSYIFLGPARESEVQKTDAALQAALHSVVGEFRQSIDEAEIRAIRLAGSPRVRRAFARQDRGKLIQLSRSSPNVAFLSRGGNPIAGRIPEGSIRRSVGVAEGDRRLGAVVVGVRLDEALANRLRDSSRVPNDIVVAISRDGGVEASSTGISGQLDLSPFEADDVRLDGSTFRAIEIPLAAQPDEARLVVLRPIEAVRADVELVRRRIFAAVAGVMGGIALIAYALAPAIVRSRTALAERAQAALVLSHVADGIFLVDQRGVILFWNPAAEAITGLSADDVRGRRVEDAIPGWADVSAKVPVSASEQAWVAPEVVPIAVDHRECWLSISGVEFSEGVVFAFRDISEEQRVNAWKNDFVATVSHELRTPLSSIFGAAVTLRRTGRAIDESKRNELLEILSDQTNRLAVLIDEILVASRLSSGALPIKRESFDPIELGRDAVASERARIPKGIWIDFVSPDSSPSVAGDSSRARQVLENLVDNAVKYSPRGGRIEVRLKAIDGFMRFSVSDEGLGIPGSEQGRIFEKFYRLDASMERGIGGAGLGLYISRELVRQMHGRIWVSSEPGVGSTFSFTLPLVESDAASKDFAYQSGSNQAL